MEFNDLVTGRASTRKGILGDERFDLGAAPRTTQNRKTADTAILVILC